MNNIEDWDDFPSVGLTPFDAWMTQVWILGITSKFCLLTEPSPFDREHFRMYYDLDYSPQDAFEEDLTAYGD